MYYHTKNNIKNKYDQSDGHKSSNNDDDDHIIKTYTSKKGG